MTVPYSRVTISNRHADVMSGQLATEKHGKEKQAFIDLKFRFLLEAPEVDLWIDPDHAIKPGAAPSAHIWDEGLSLRLPRLKLSGAIRDNLKGDLDIKFLGEEYSFKDAHLVGSVSKIEFIAGGHAEVILQLRVAADEDLDALVALIEKGDCELEFSEYGESATAANDDSNQEQMAV